MVDAARQMLDELMGRNRNLHPSEAVRKISWDDPDFCQYYIVHFCPHDLFVNTRADLGPCTRHHDEEAKEMYNQARPSPRKRQYEDEFLRFCMTMLNDVDRKIQKGKQRLQLMNKDQPVQSLQSKFQEQVNNLNARINKLLSEAEEAGTRGDVDQAQDLMTLCEKLKEEKEAVLAQYEHHMSIKAKLTVGKPASPIPPLDVMSETPIAAVAVSPKLGVAADNKPLEYAEENVRKFSMENSAVAEKQMEVCETCGAFLIVGDAQQRIEDHLMGKQHLGYSKLRQAVEELQTKRQKEREEEEKARREERKSREPRTRDSREPRDTRDVENHKRRERDHHSRSNDSHDNRRRSRDRHSSRRTSDNYREPHKSKHSKHSRSRDRSSRRSRERKSRSRSRY